MSGLANRRENGALEDRGLARIVPKHLSELLGITRIGIGLSQRNHVSCSEIVRPGEPCRADRRHRTLGAKQASDIGFPRPQPGNHTAWSRLSSDRQVVQ